MVLPVPDAEQAYTDTSGKPTKDLFNYLKSLDDAVRISNSTSAVNSVVNINDNTTHYVANDYDLFQNCTAGYTRDVDFVERITVNTATFPENYFVSWTWVPVSNVVKSYPRVLKEYGHVHTWSFYSEISTEYAWDVADPPAKNFATSYNVLLELWTSSPTNELEVFLQRYGQINRREPQPFKRITCGSLFQRTFDIQPLFDVWQKFLIFPIKGDPDNLFDNESLSGSVAGTPGTDPTNCRFLTTPDVTGLTKTIVGSGTAVAADGLTVNYVDVRYNGTPGNTSRISNVFARDLSNTSTIATPNPARTDLLFTVYMAVVAGSLTNISRIWMDLKVRDNTLFNLVADAGTAANIGTYISSTLQRWAVQYIDQTDTVGGCDGTVFLEVTNGAAIDVTMRFAAPKFSYDPELIIKQDYMDWKSLLTAMAAQGMLTGSELLGSIQLAPEIFYGHGSFHVQHFNVNAS